MDIYYINSIDERIDLDKWPIAVTDITQLFGRAWDVVGIENYLRRRSRLKYITRTTKEFPLDISIYADSLDEYSEIINNFENVTDYDLRNESPGRLYVGEYYLECFIRDTSPADFEELFDTVDITLTVYSLFPHWEKETKYSFEPEANQYVPGEHPPQESGGTYGEPLDYPYIRRDYMYDYKHPDDYSVLYAEYDYAYDYVPVLGIKIVDNDTEYGADFIMYIHGYIVNPTVVIGGYTYMVETTVYGGETLIINSRENTIVKIDQWGNEQNVFNSRSKSQSVFEQIQPGTQLVNWPGTYELEITVFTERSEPEWIF